MTVLKKIFGIYSLSIFQAMLPPINSSRYYNTGSRSTISNENSLSWNFDDHSIVPSENGNLQQSVNPGWPDLDECYRSDFISDEKCKKQEYDINIIQSLEELLKDETSNDIIQESENTSKSSNDFIEHSEGADHITDINQLMNIIKAIYSFENAVDDAHIAHYIFSLECMYTNNPMLASDLEALKYYLEKCTDDVIYMFLYRMCDSLISDSNINNFSYLKNQTCFNNPMGYFPPQFNHQNHSYQQKHCYPQTYFNDISDDLFQRLLNNLKIYDTQSNMIWNSEKNKILAFLTKHIGHFDVIIGNCILRCPIVKIIFASDDNARYVRLITLFARFFIINNLFSSVDKSCILHISKLKMYQAFEILLSSNFEILQCFLTFLPGLQNFTIRVIEDNYNIRHFQFSYFESALMQCFKMPKMFYFSLYYQPLNLFAHVGNVLNNHPKYYFKKTEFSPKDKYIHDKTAQEDPNYKNDSKKLQVELLNILCSNIRSNNNLLCLSLNGLDYCKISLDGLTRLRSLSMWNCSGFRLCTFENLSAKIKVSFHYCNFARQAKIISALNSIEPLSCAEFHNCYNICFLLKDIFRLSCPIIDIKDLYSEDLKKVRINKRRIRRGSKHNLNSNHKDIDRTISITPKDNMELDLGKLYSSLRTMNSEKTTLYINKARYEIDSWRHQLVLYSERDANEKYLLE